MSAIGIVQAIEIIDPVRAMAAQCAQCHGMEGNHFKGFDYLDGETEAEIKDELIEMIEGSDSEVMHFQAKGYTPGDVAALAKYFAGQIKVNADSSGSSEDEYDEDD